ncbi:S-adenosyl-l-methionine hydroxide adenosyltransferase family protein [Magnetospirillum sp. UT-4]|uniref:SAM hydrolase/SAM-dependent halogenase family protein n=1 Tax=Magnetospirillum sp. UT-4 TaxID=2681467 RepID=UPI001385F86C|nr:SAM-dependent chlorinase/fluorinase [Magnetospirillum sp. UT-4]CAA7615243.1 Protein containing DUF62 [Magnetospirillum sp. UT-4]
MARPIILFTDFGPAGPYVGQMRAVLATRAPGAAIIDLVSDAPAFDPMLSAYLLAALLPEMPPGAVVAGVVDPGVGGDRAALVAEADGRLLVGPDNGLFEIALRRAGSRRAWRLDWRPGRLSATFHGRDLFAPVAARLANGEPPEAVAGPGREVPDRPDWPDDLARIVYVDHYGNAMTGLRATLPGDAVLIAGGRPLLSARTYSDLPPGSAFWYANSIGLIEVAVSGGRAADVLSLAPGDPVALGQNPDAGHFGNG